MKKVVILCLTLVMVMTLSLQVFAVGGFVSSPSGDAAPELDSFENEDASCTVDVTIVPYVSRDDLSDESLDEMESAYAEIIAGETSSLGAAFDELSAQGQVAAGDLAVSDLFAVLYANCDFHADHGTTTITLTAETVEHFVGLLVYEDDAWGVVNGDRYFVQGDKLTFESTASTYAIVVDTTYLESSPATAQDEAGSISPVWYVLMAVSVIGMAVVAILYGRVRANESK